MRYSPDWKSLDWVTKEWISKKYSSRPGEDSKALRGNLKSAYIISWFYHFRWHRINSESSIFQANKWETLNQSIIGTISLIRNRDIARDL